jgi:hypothetical protein
MSNQLLMDISFVCATIGASGFTWGLTMLYMTRRS